MTFVKCVLSMCKLKHLICLSLFKKLIYIATHNMLLPSLSPYDLSLPLPPLIFLTLQVSGSHVGEASSSKASDKFTVPVDLPEESAESAVEVAERLRATVQSGDYRKQYRTLVTVKPQSGSTHSK